MNKTTDQLNMMCKENGEIREVFYADGTYVDRQKHFIEEGDFLVELDWETHEDPNYRHKVQELFEALKKKFAEEENKWTSEKE